MTRSAVAIVSFFSGVAVLASAPMRAAADTWLEIASPNFTVVSNAGDGTARNVAWQFEQIRSAIIAGWPWARPDLDRPFVVVAVKDERTMRTFAPQYWERGVRVRPGSVSVPALDRHYVLLRTDLRADGPEGVNPYRMAYWGYSHLVLSEAFGGRLPFWFGVGLSELLSNTNITNREVQFGRPIPWHVAEFRTGRYSLAQLFDITSGSPAFGREIERQRFDAQCWALMHYLVFGDDDRERSQARLNELARLTLGGMPSLAAVEQVFGGVDALDAAYRLYLDRGMFRYMTMSIDARVQSRDFRGRELAAAEAAALRASYLTSTTRLVEARAAVDEAKAADASLAATHAAEARLLDRENRADEARAAYEKAAAAGSDNAWVYVRLASLTPRQGATPETLARLEEWLNRAVAISPRSANALHLLGGVLLQMNRTDDAIIALRRAATADPLQSVFRLTLANALARAGQREAAMREAQAALALARTDQQRAAAQQMIDRIGG